MKKSIACLTIAAAFVSLGILAPSDGARAAEDSSDEKLDQVIATQAKIQSNQEKILAMLNDIRGELKIVKIRASR